MSTYRFTTRTVKQTELKDSTYCVLPGEIFNREGYMLYVKAPLASAWDQKSADRVTWRAGTLAKDMCIEVTHRIVNPAKQGRPALPPDAPRSDKKARSVRLGEAHWAKFKVLGTAWLEAQLDRERVTVDIDGVDETCERFFRTSQTR